MLHPLLKCSTQEAKAAVDFGYGTCMSLGVSFTLIGFQWWWFGLPAYVQSIRSVDQILAQAQQVKALLQPHVLTLELRSFLGSSSFILFRILADGCCFLLCMEC